MQGVAEQLVENWPFGAARVREDWLSRGNRATESEERSTVAFSMSANSFLNAFLDHIFILRRKLRQSFLDACHCAHLVEDGKRKVHNS